MASRKTEFLYTLHYHIIIWQINEIHCLRDNYHCCCVVGNYVLTYLGTRLNLASYVSQSLIQVHCLDSIFFVDVFY